MVRSAFELPDLLGRCPTPQRPTNPNCSYVEKRFDEWLNTCPWMLAKERESIRRCVIPLFAACWYRKESLEVLLQTTFYLFQFAYIDDKGDVDDLESARAHYSLCLDVWNGLEGNSPLEPFSRVISDASTRSLSVIHERYHKGILATNAEFPQAMVKEVALRTAAQPGDVGFRTLAEYFALRRKSVGVRPLLTYLRGLRDLEIPQTVLQRPEMEAAETALIDTVILSNDLYSYKKELISNGAPENILTVMLRDPQLQINDLQTAIDRVAIMFDAALAQLEKSRTEMGSGDPVVTEYFEGMFDFLVGNIEWCLSCPRYASLGGEEEKMPAFVAL
ncbi:isoprenoid synthase domain-containing protein [Phlebopus sp. FC_14]|nr:isoprenoid synthase domain-containing protein [Phlebopus sp. FC_14]